MREREKRRYREREREIGSEKEIDQPVYDEDPETKKKNRQQAKGTKAETLNCGEDPENQATTQRI